MKVSKSNVAQVTIGNKVLDCYQMPDGCYKFSVKQAAEACNLSPKRVPQIWEKKELKELLGEALSVPQTYEKAHVETLEGIRLASLMEMKYVQLLWASCNTLEGQSLNNALALESLERRADSAFGVVRNEQERNDRLAARVNHKDGWRKNFTDWQKQDGVEGIGYAKRVNQLKLALGLPLVSIEEYDSLQVRTMTHGEVSYHSYRKIGKTHQEAISFL